MYFYGFLRDFYVQNPILVTTNLAFSLLIPVQDILLPHYYGKLIDAMTNKKDLIKYVGIVICIFTFVEFGFIMSDWHDIKTSSGFQTFARKEILNNVLSKYDDHYSDIYIGKIMSQIVKLPHTLVVWYERMKSHIIPYILVFGFAVCYFGRTDKWLGLTLFITAVLYASIVIGFPQTYCQSSSSQKDKVINEIHEQIDDIFRNFVAMHGDKEIQKQEIDRLQDYEKLFTVKFAETMKCLMKTKCMTSIVILSFTIFFILRSYKLIQNQKLTTATFSSLFLILIYLNGMMMWVESQLRESIFDWGIISESDDLFKKPLQRKIEKQNTKENEDDDYLVIEKPTIPQRDGVGMINVMFGFPESGKKILKDITFHVEKGETVVIVGNIGSGKSTILKLLLKFIEPDSGTIYVDGRSYNDMSIKEIKRRVGFVPQHPILFDRSVLENILYGTSGVNRDQVVAFLKEFNILKEFSNLKHGLDSRVGKNGSRLSGGQRQIVLCLRAYFQNNDIIIMDEPTASLDKLSKDTLKRVINVTMQNKTVIIVTHDNELLKIAERKIYVVDGKIQEATNDGSPFKGSMFIDDFYNI
jgi:ABC-type multidrug transport system fused ATPase/permease subunit